MPVQFISITMPLQQTAAKDSSDPPVAQLLRGRYIMITWVLAYLPVNYPSQMDELPTDFNWVFLRPHHHHDNVLLPMMIRGFSSSKCAFGGRKGRGWCAAVDNKIGNRLLEDNNTNCTANSVHAAAAVQVPGGHRPLVLSCGMDVIIGRFSYQLVL